MRRLRISLGPRGLRARIVVGFAAVTLVVSAVLVATTFLLARSYLLGQRESTLTHQAFTDADVLRSRLSTTGTKIGDALGDLVPSGGSYVVVHSGFSWYSSSLDVGARDVPPSLRATVESGSAATTRTGSATGPRFVVGVPVASAGIQFYEVSPLSELQMALRTLSAVLGAGALAATVAGAVLGYWASRRAVAPLEQVAGAATRIAAGELTTRLETTDDPDLVAIVSSFNTMVDALAARIERDARFVGDVSHELRSPLTSLVTSVEVMATRRAELSPRAQQALQLVEEQLSRFRATLDDLLELARLDNAPAADPPPTVGLRTLVAEVLASSGRPAELLDARAGGGTAADGDPTAVSADKHQLERAVRNLLDNADRHAGGARRVSVRRQGASVLLAVDDAGPGVSPDDRERIFERFARGPQAARGSLPGAGLGLAIVAETAARLGGAAWCSASPHGGARFTLSVPAAPAGLPSAPATDLPASGAAARSLADRPVLGADR